jgi:murein L,D-transpeptidase YcbB/YkuD
MRKAAVIGMFVTFAAAPAFGQPSGAAAPATPARPPAAVVQPAPAKPSAPASTPASRSAAALALSTEPTFDEGTYQRLKEMLLSYSSLQVRGGWPALPADAKLAPGSTGPNVALLRRRLAITEDLAADKEQGDVYDDVLTEAVKRFQLRHGLDATGSLGPKTLTALNVPIKRRLQQLQASLERLVGMDFLFAQRYVVVNIPAAFAEAVANDKVERRYVVIVGKTDKRSPTLTASITSVNLNPTWTVPLSITKNEVIAKMRKDPGYLSRMHMRVLDARDGELEPQSIDWSSDRSPNFHVRQDSGTWNALGAVKIDMPNPYSVYMHDTNTRNLFAGDYRFLSHGCTRVDNVRDLAAWLLEETPGWNRDRIDAAIATGQRTDVRLTKKVPVAWVYLTGWVTRDGTVQFRDDVYDDDYDAPSPTADASALMTDVRAGGFVAPRETREIKQGSYLDSR